MDASWCIEDGCNNGPKLAFHTIAPGVKVRTATSPINQNPRRFDKKVSQSPPFSPNQLVPKLHEQSIFLNGPPAGSCYSCCSSLSLDSTSSSCLTTSALTLHRFSKGFDLRHYGRTREIELLIDAYKAVRGNYDATMASSRFLLLQGSSGTGKSSICEILREPAVRDGAYYVNGNSDKLHRYHPLYSLWSALSDLCDILVSEQQAAGTIKHSPVSSLTQEVATIFDMMVNSSPDASFLADASTKGQNASQIGGRKVLRLRNNEASLNNFKRVCRSLFQTVASPRSPVVLVLDDLQWADKESIEVLEFLLADEDSGIMNHVLIIGTYSDQGDLRIPPQLTRLIQEAASSTKVHPGTTTVFRVPALLIRLGYLDESNICSMLSGILGVRGSEAEPLARVIHRKTNGIPRDIAAFLDSLQDNHLLYKNTSGSWEWDIDRIQAETDVSSDVAPLPIVLNHLSSDMKTFMKIAACLGYSFKLELLFAIYTTFFSRTTTDTGEEQDISIRSRLMENALLACQKGLLENLKTVRVKFANVQIHSAACALFNSKEEIANMHLSVGRLMRQRYDQENDRSSEDKFQCLVMHLNKGSGALRDPKEQEELAELNSKAGFISMSHQEFADATVYYQAGIQLLRCPWTNYELTLKLKISLAEAQHSSGQFDACCRTLDEITFHPIRRGDFILSTFIRVTSLREWGRIHQSNASCLDILHVLGEKTSCHRTRLSLLDHRRVAHIIWASLSRTHTSSETRALSIPNMKNKKQILAMTALSILLTNTYCQLHQGIRDEQSHALFLFASFKMVKLTLRFGLSEYAPMAFAGYATSIATSQPKVSRRFARLAQRLLQYSSSISTEVAVPTQVMIHSLSWREQHLEESIDPLLEVYTLGNSSLVGLMGAIWSLRAAFSCGHNLHLLADDTLGIIATIKTKPQALLVYQLLMPQWGLVAIFTGEGDAYDGVIDYLDTIIEEDDDDDEEKEEEENLQTLVMNANFFHIVTQCFIGDWSVPSTMGDAILEPTVVSAQHFTMVDFTFFTALHSIDLAARRDTALVLVHRHIKELKSWCRQGAVDCQPRIAILEAEAAAQPSSMSHGTDSSFDAVTAKYEKAIDACGIRYPHLAALANERLSAFLRSRPQQDSGSADRFLVHLREARSLYLKWGAVTKVEQLEKTLSNYPNRASRAFR